MKNFITTLTLVMMSLLASAQLFSQEWPMINGDKSRSSWAKNEQVLYPPLSVKSHQDVFAEHSAFYDGRIYISGGNRLTAYDPAAGQIEWIFVLDSAGGSNGVVPAVSDSIVLCGGQGGLGLHAVHRNSGQQLWLRMLGSLYTRSPVIDEGRVYIIKDSLYCLDLERGTTIWTHPTSGQKTPTLDEQHVYFCGNGFEAYDKRSGDSVWSNGISCASSTSLIVDDQRVYGQSGNTIKALDKTNGIEVWSYSIPHGNLPFLTEGAMAVSDSILCFVLWDDQSDKGNVYVLDKFTGLYIWHYQYPMTGAFTPTIANGVVYNINWQSGHLYAFQLSNGQVLAIDSSAHYTDQPIVANGRLFAASNSGLREISSQAASLSATDQHEAVLINKPNPFRNASWISYSVDKRSHVTVEVYDILGRRIETIINQNKMPGRYEVQIDGHQLPAGMYYAVLRLDRYQTSCAMLKIE